MRRKLYKRKPPKEKVIYGIHTPTRSETNVDLCWEDVKDMKEGYFTATYMDDTLPGGPHEKTVEYHAPFTRAPSREEAYAEAWAFFEKNKGWLF